MTYLSLIKHVPGLLTSVLIYAEYRAIAVFVCEENSMLRTNILSIFDH